MQILLLVAAALSQQAGSATLTEGAKQVGAYELAYPYPSPDGEELAFQSNMDGRWQLYAMRTRDGSIRRLHTSASDDRNPAWSPDGRKIAFVSTRDSNDEVYILDLTSGSVQSVAPHPGRDGHPKWSADGRWLVFNRTFDPADKEGDENSAIVRVREDGSGFEVISDTPLIETFPSFSPDGGSVVFVEWHPDAAGTPARNGELMIVDLQTKERRNITNSFAFDGYPHWGPSGDWIYFSSAADGPAGREAVVYRVRPDGSGRERITELDGFSEVRAIPTADEQWLYFNREEGGRVLLYRMPLK